MSKSEHIILRASPDFVELLKRTAEAEGVSKSEAIRRAVTEKDQRMSIDLHELATADPFALLGAAARGDVEAFRKMAVLSWAAAIQPDEDGAPELHWENGDPYALIETSLMFSRLAAAAGDERDVIGLTNSLHLASDLGCGDADEQVAEALAWIEREADAGSEKAASALNRLTAAATPEAVEAASKFASRLKLLPRNPTGVN